MSERSIEFLPQTYAVQRLLDFAASDHRSSTDLRIALGPVVNSAVQESFRPKAVAMFDEWVDRYARNSYSGGYNTLVEDDKSDDTPEDLDTRLGFVIEVMTFFGLGEQSSLNGSARVYLLGKAAKCYAELCGSTEQGLEPNISAEIFDKLCQKRLQTLLDEATFYDKSDPKATHTAFQSARTLNEDLWFLAKAKVISWPDAWRTMLSGVS